MTNIAALPRTALMAGTVLAVSLLAAACGGGAPTATKTTSATTVPATTTTAAPASSPTSTSAPGKPGANPAGNPGDGAGFAPAATGTIASITGQILEVQNKEQAQQTTVNLTAKTAISATLSMALSDVTVGTCITATGTKGAAGAVDAASVVIEPTTAGNCTLRGGFGGGAGFGGGFRGGAGGGTPPGGTGTTRSVPGGARFRVPANEANVIGKVTAVSGTTITVKGFSISGFGRPAGAAPVPATVPKTVTETVTVSAKTTYVKTERVNASALKVGECATAFGSTNDIGAVTATRLTVTQPTAQGCVATFGFRGGFGGGFGRGGGGGFGGGSGTPSVTGAPA